MRSGPWLLTLFLFGLPSAAAPTLTIGSATANAGSQLCIKLALTNSQTPSIVAWTADVTYDAGKLSGPSVSTTVGGKLAQGNAVSAGVYRVTVYGGTNAFPDGEAATICFNTSQGNCGTVSMGFASGTPTASDANANPVAITGQGASATISGCGSGAASRITVATNSVPGGSQGCLNLSLSNSATPNITAFSADLTYDSSSITPASISTAVSGKLAQGSVISAGVYRITIYGGTNAIPDGNAAAVCFSTTSSKCGTFNVGFASGTPTASDANANSVAVTGSGGALTVSGCSGGTSGVSLLIGSSSGSAGGNVCLPLTLRNDGSPRIAALTADVLYDSTRLTPSGVTTNVSGKVAQGNIVSPGRYRFTIYGGTSAFSDGTVGSVCFGTQGGQCGEFAVTFASGSPQASDANANSVSVSGSNGAVTATGCGPSQVLYLSRSRIRASVEWRSQYNGTSGIGQALPQKDEFGYFYFSDQNNPEVFVKCLDFGSGTAIILVGGTTDFYYKLTFRNSRDETLVFEKPAGSLVGFANNNGLNF